MRTSRACATTLVITLWGASVVCTAAPAANSHDHVAQLPIVVDGRKTPELVPDDVAYGHLIISLAEHSNPTVEEIRGRESRILQIGLSAQDAQALVNALTGVREQLDGIDAIRIRLGNSPKLRSQWESIIKDARDHMRTALSADGSLRLDMFVRKHVKPLITIFGSN